MQIVKYLLSVSKVKDGAYSLNQMGFTALEVLDHCPEDLKNVTIRKILLDAGIERARNQTNLQPQLAVVIGHHEPAKPVQPSKNWRLKWIEYLSYQGDWLGEMRGALMVEFRKQMEPYVLRVMETDIILHVHPEPRSKPVMLISTSCTQFS